MKETMTVTQLARRLGKSRTTLYRALNNGDFDFLGARHVSGSWVIPRRPVDAWLGGDDVEAAVAAVPEHPQITFVRKRTA